MVLREESLQGLVLAVDDEAPILRLLSAALRSMGLAVEPAPDGEVALRLARTSRPDLILLDINLPGMNGLEVARRLKGNGETAMIPVLLISAHAEPARHEADGFIAKPFDLDELTERVTSLLSRTRTPSGSRSI